MNLIELVAGWAETGSASPTYSIAQALLLSDLQAPALDPFATGKYGQWGQGIDRAGELLEMGGVLTYSGPGWIGNCWRDVVCRRMSTAYLIEIDGVAHFSVLSSGLRVSQIERSDSCTNEVLVEAALGPPLILALALQGKYCLHAGAVVAAGKGVVFVAESGYGKSTLARFMGARPGAAAIRISDDILPLSLGSAQQLVALPHYPQLKLASSEQPLGAPAEVPLHTIYFLEKDKPGRDGVIEMRPMTKMESTLGLVANTVAARLFDQQLLADHLTFCAEAAARIRARRLFYPRSVAMLPELAEAILADLQE